MSALRAPRARVRSAPSQKSGSNPHFCHFGVLGGFRTKNATSSSHVGTNLYEFRRDRNILRSNRPKCGSGRRLVEGVDMRKSQKSPSSEPRPTRHPPLCFFKKSLRCRQNVHFFPKGPLRGTKSSVITSRARSPSVLRRKNGFQPRFGAFLANSILGRLVAPNVSPTRLMMPLLDIIGANARLGGVNTPRTPPK